MNKAYRLALAAALMVCLSTFPAPGDAAAEAEPAVQAAVGDSSFLTGNWRGAKLRCRKEEGKAVRCGKPEPFVVTFNADGTGQSEDEKFPSAFTYRWKSATEITVTPDDGSGELKLFQIEHDEGFLTFQAYIYLPVENPDLPAEVNYIHYIFDVSLDE